MSACKERTKVVDITVIPPMPPPVDSMIYSILPYDSTILGGMNWHYKDIHAGVLTADGVDSLEPIVDSAYKAFTKDTADPFHKLMPLKDYRRQYVAVVTDKGERAVWVNFFCEDIGVEWRKEILTVKDGGNCFFELVIDVNKRKAYELSPNGEAFLPAEKKAADRS
jgi:hypothetical protein